VIAFADSSVVVARYAPHEVDVLPDGATVVVSHIARVEVASALWRQSRDGLFSPADAATFLREFEADWVGTPFESAKYHAITVDRTVLTRAAGLTGIHSLRTLDAIQLASALAARDAEPECQTMVVLDERLRWAAATEGFALLPVR
jgi:predicted nucleic acid-binding protein